MIEFTQLIHFVCIAEAGTLTQAAKQLHISQPALTRSMQKLEEALQIPLFERKKNKIMLTDTGQFALIYAKEILAKQEEMRYQLQHFEQQKNTIFIGSCAPAPLWGLKHVFRKLIPEWNVQDVIDSNEELLLKGLQQQEYAIVVLTKPIDDPNYICCPLFEESLYVSVPSTHRLATLKEIHFADMNGESIFLFSKIGFWNEICLRMIPQSHLFIQEDMNALLELTKLSVLPNFKSNITIAIDDEMEDRVNIPIMDKEATVLYYAVYAKKKNDLFKNSIEEIKQIDWKSINIE